jgi:hypothetical protein
MCIYLYIYTDIYSYIFIFPNIAFLSVCSISCTLPPWPTVCTCIYVYVYIYTYMFTYINIYVYIHICLCIYTYVCLLTFIFINSFFSVCNISYMLPPWRSVCTRKEDPSEHCYKVFMYALIYACMCICRSTY